MINQRQPHIFAIAGAPCSGKSTYINKLFQENVVPPTAFLHDCDTVMETLPGYQEDVKQLGSAIAFSKWELPARHLAELALFQAVEQKQDIIYDRSCALTSSYKFIHHLVKEQDYLLIFYHLEIDLRTALQRAKMREKHIGRHIPPIDIEARMNQLQKLLPLYQVLAHQYFTIAQ